MFKTLLKTKLTYVLTALYVFQLVWWLSMQFLYNAPARETYWFNIVYGNIAIVGFVSAFVIAQRKWGGWQSLFGKMLIFLGLGLLMEYFGIVVWLYYNLTGADVPYPSLADVGYFGLIPMYITASVMLARAAGLHFALRTVRGKLVACLIPLGSLAIAFGFFLRNITDTSPLKLFFDIGYPVGEIVPITIAGLVLIFSTKMLAGGIMRSRVFWLVFAFFMQFLAEYTFLYQAAMGTYTNANIADMLYATSYFIMGLGIISFRNIEQG